MFLGGSNLKGIRVIDEYRVPNAPIIGVATSSGTTATVNFTAPDFDGETPILSYTAISSPDNITSTVYQSGSGSIDISGLTAGVTYTFTVYATNFVGDSASSQPSNSLIISTVPGTPTVGTPTITSGTSITVPYTAPLNDGGQTITSYTAVSNPGNITATVYQSDSGSITVTGLTKGTSYTFRVYATNPVGNSLNSSASASIIPSTVPDAPGVGTPTTASGTSINVPFIAPPDNGGRTITSYTAVSSPGNITGTLSQAGSGTITVTGLTKGTSYTFTVYATNALGNGASSASSTSIIPSTTPGTPTVGSPSIANDTSVYVPFTAPADDGGVPITSYTAVSSPGNITGTLSQAGSGTITVTGLTKGTSYTFTVYATNARGNGSSSTPSGTVIPSSVPGVPTVGSPTIASGTSINVPFTAPADNGGQTITSYTAVSSPGNITGTISQSGSGTITVSGLTKGTSYTFVVYATNPVGNSSNSSSSVSIIPSTVPGAPTIGTPTIASGTSINVPFTAPADNGGQTITSYTAVSSPGNITGTLSQSGSGTITVSGLTKGTSYTFTVYATNNVGNSSNSSASASITPSTVPGAPTIGSPTVLSSTSVSVPFTAPADNGGNTIISYTTTSTPGSISNTIYQSGSGNITVSGLTQATPYTFVVYATNHRGSGANSSASVSVTPAGVPDAPTIGTPTMTSATSVDVPFTAPAFNGGSTITSYTVVSSPGNITGTISQSGSGTISVSGLTTNSSYTFTVYATNAYGDSLSSSASGEITLAQGQVEFTTAGSYTWTCPSGVTSISYVAISGGGGGGASYGGGGGGGQLAYGNNITVVPGRNYTIFVGAGGGTGVNNTGGRTWWYDTVASANLVVIYGGSGGIQGNNSNPGGGGGAAGYAGVGGHGGSATHQGINDYSGGSGGTVYSGTAITARFSGGGGGLGNSIKGGGLVAGSGSGGGGGGGSAGGYGVGFGGGGVGIYGQGANGPGGAAVVLGSQPNSNGNHNGGSGGGDATSSTGALYGGGGAGNGSGRNGAFRIIWPGTYRYFPATNTADM